MVHLLLRWLQLPAARLPAATRYPAAAARIQFSTPPEQMATVMVITVSAAKAPDRLRAEPSSLPSSPSSMKQSAWVFSWKNR